MACMLDDTIDNGSGTTQATAVALGVVAADGAVVNVQRPGAIDTTAVGVGGVGEIHQSWKAFHRPRRYC